MNYDLHGITSSTCRECWCSHMTKVLLIEDDLELSNRLSDWLKKQLYDVECAADGEAAISLLSHYHYDLMIVDWNVPGMSGLDVCRNYRNSGGKAPVLMLTGHSETKDKSIGLDSGADDYLTKPFVFEELAARLRALLRRQPTYEGVEMRLGDLIVDRNSHQVKFRGESIHLHPKEFEILDLLGRNKDSVISQESILERVWPNASDATTASVRTNMKTLRKKLDKVDCVRILTVHGYGYQLRVIEH